MRRTTVRVMALVTLGFGGWAGSAGAHSCTSLTTPVTTIGTCEPHEPATHDCTVMNVEAGVLVVCVVS